MMKMLATKLVWILGIITSLNAVTVLPDSKNISLTISREEEMGDLLKFNISNPNYLKSYNDSCATKGSTTDPDECQQATLEVMNGKIASYLGYALKCNGGNCGCHNTTSPIQGVGKKTRVKCLRKDLKNGVRCIHSRECVKGHVCLPAINSTKFGQRECQNLSIFLKPNYYIVAILIIIPVLLGLQDIMQ